MCVALIGHKGTDSSRTYDATRRDLVASRCDSIRASSCCHDAAAFVLGLMGGGWFADRTLTLYREMTLLSMPSCRLSEATVAQLR